MNLTQVMSVHGKALGPLGVAVYAFIEANPRASYAEVAEGLAMGESTVRKCARQLNTLGLVARDSGKNDNGLCLPARLSISDPAISEPRSIVQPDIQERATSDNPVISEQVANTGVSLSDPVPIYRATSGTPVAPLLPKTTITEKNSNNNRAGEAEPSAFAHEVHPAVGVYRDVFGTDPPVYGQDQITRDVTDLRLWREVCEQWKGNNNASNKVWNMVDRYRKRVATEGKDDAADSTPRRTYGKQPVTRDLSVFAPRTGS